MTSDYIDEKEKRVVIESSKLKFRIGFTNVWWIIERYEIF